MDRRIPAFWESLRKKNVSVIGLGITNNDLIRLMLQKGIPVTIYDRKERTQIGELADELEGLGARLVLGPDHLKQLSGDVIFRAPGVYFGRPEITRARENGAAVTSGRDAGGRGRAGLTGGDIALRIQCRNGGKGSVFRLRADGEERTVNHKAAFFAGFRLQQAQRGECLIAFIAGHDRAVAVLDIPSRGERLHKTLLTGEEGEILHHGNTCADFGQKDGLLQR